MQHNQRNILIAVLLTMLVLKGCSAPNKQKPLKSVGRMRMKP